MKTFESRMMMANSRTPLTAFPVPARLLFFFLLLAIVLSSHTQASDLGLTESDCRCCHGSTLADRHHLMVIERGLECLACHQMTWNSTDLQYEVVVVRNCPQCHTGSLADRHHLLVDQVTFNCFTCHTIVWDPDTLMYVPDFNASCNAPPPPPSVLSANINGSVNDTSGTGLGWVRVTTDKGDHSTLTTADGAFQLPDIAPGDYVVTASADGYISASKPVSIVESQSVSVDLVLSPMAILPTIDGWVMDSKQSPIEGARIFSDNGLYSTISAADGSFTLLDVALGTLTLTAEKNGYGSKSQSLAVTTGQLLTTEFVLPELPQEICNDGLDNDSNGLTDCTDPLCSNTAACLPPVEICGDGADNDANGLTDCGDPTCMGTAACPSPSVELCNDGIDNDGNGLSDCADPVCSALALCLPESCTDGIDNNGDGLIDCSDPVCANTSKCLSPPVEICTDGLDNDANGQIDCADDKCSSKPACAQPGGGGTPEESACEYIVQSEWETGFTAIVRIRNKGTSPTNGWEVNWEYPDGNIINNSWNANLSGSNPYTADSLNWNAVVYPGQSVEFGMLGQKTVPPAQVPVVSGPLCNAGGGLTCEYIVQSEWETGFTAVVRLRNEGSVPIDGWEVNWEYSDSSVIASYWNANFSGANPYQATNLSWNSAINPGMSVEFGMVGQKNTLPAQVPALSGSVCGN